MPTKEEAITQGELIYYAHTLDTGFEELKIAPISDAHYGNPLFSKKHFLRTIDFLEIPEVFTFGNGDLCESALKTSKVGRWQPRKSHLARSGYPYNA